MRKGVKIFRNFFTEHISRPKKSGRV